MVAMLAGLSARTVALFALVVLGQIFGSALLVRSNGFTSPGWSLLCAVVYAVSLYSLSLLLREGGALSLLMPLLAAVVPIGTILIAVVWLGERASYPKLALLGLACLIVATSNRV